MMRDQARKEASAVPPQQYRAWQAMSEDAVSPARFGFRARAAKRIIIRTITVGTACALAACSFSMPLSPFGSTTDPVVTGSIGPISPLDPSLDQEDWRRARAALAVALDPQGNGARAGWENPETGRSGDFEAASRAFVRDDRVCRDFTAQLSLESGDERRLRGSACRFSENLWRVDDVAPDQTGGA
jgi:surface antigen